MPDGYYYCGYDSPYAVDLGQMATYYGGIDGYYLLQPDGYFRQYGYYNRYGYCGSPEAYGYYYGYYLGSLCEPRCRQVVYAEHIENSDTVDFHLQSDMPCCWQPWCYEQVIPEGEYCTASASVRYILRGCVRPFDVDEEGCPAWIAPLNGEIYPLQLPAFGKPGGGVAGGWSLFCPPLDCTPREEVDGQGCRIVYGTLGTQHDCERNCIDYVADEDVLGNLFWRKGWWPCSMTFSESESYRPSGSPTFLGETVTTCLD